MVTPTVSLPLDRDFFEMLDEGRRTEVRKPSGKYMSDLRNKKIKTTITLRDGYLSKRLQRTRTFDLIDIELLDAEAYIKMHDTPVFEIADAVRCMAIKGKVIVYHFVG